MSSLNAAAAATIRRLTAVLNDIDPADTTALQRLRDLCEQLHLSQSAIDEASEGKADVAPVPGFPLAVLAFTERLHAALQGKAPALVLHHSADVEAICLGLCAFASVKAPSPYFAHPDLMNKARQALDGITSGLLAIVDALFAKLLALSAVRATVLSPPGARLPIRMQWPPSLPPQALPYKDVLDLAIQGGNRDMARSLLQVQEVLDAVDKRGDYAQAVLLQCINHRMPDLALALLQRPLVARIVRTPDSTGMTALHHAARLGQAQVVANLLGMLPASEIARSNREGKSAFLLAKESGHEKTASILAAAAAGVKATLTQ